MAEHDTDVLHSDLKDADALAPSIPWRFMVPLHIVAIVSMAFTVVFSYAEVFPFTNPLGIYRLLPGDILIDFVWLYIISVAIGIVVYLTSRHLSLLQWKMHRLITGRNCNYHIQALDPRVGHMGYIRRLIIPAFVSLGLASTLSSNSSIVDFLFVTESFDTLAPSARGIAETMPLFFILLLISSFIVIFFAPTWLLEDTGVIYERKTEGTRSTADIEGVGNYYLALLKGFAGISTIATYFLIVLQTYEWFALLPGTIEVPLWFFLLPVVVIFIAPLLAMGPISVVYSFYELALRRNVKDLERRMKSEGLERVVVELPTSVANDSTG